MKPLTRFDAERIQFILRRHGWTAYAYYDGDLWRVVCYWPFDNADDWLRGVDAGWRTIKSLHGCLDAIRCHSARERREETA